MKRGRPRSIRRRTRSGVKRRNPRQRAAIRMRGFARRRKGR